MKSPSHLVVLGVIIIAMLGGGAAWIWWPRADGQSANPDNPSQVALGNTVYESHCARCHGDKLEGEPNWQQAKPNGRLPAPPHDASGHTWHHPDAQLFGMVKHGIVPYAPAGYQSDMPAFAGTLSDEEILAVLAFIKNSWPEEIRERQMRLNR